MNKQFKSGFVTVIGRPNVGKSTFINQMIGEKVSIVSDKIQTTRQSIHGILTKEDMQAVFIDTPGVHKPKHRLGSYMVDVSLNTLQDVDLILFMVNASEGYGKGDEYIIERLKNVNTPKFLLINKVDLIDQDAIFPLITAYTERCDFDEVIPISAIDGSNMEHVLPLVHQYLPEGPQFYSDEQLTNRSERFFIAEMIREKVLIHTEEEVPHSVNVIVETMERNEHDKLHVMATVITERQSQKGIIIGKKGSMLKKIGKDARLELEAELDEKIFLELWVKVQKDWRNKQSLLHQYGFNEE